jgi:FAD/FMN-containing dehydrogenase
LRLPAGTRWRLSFPARRFLASLGATQYERSLSVVTFNLAEGWACDVSESVAKAIVKAGGNVVKNVAGYDLGKLVSGSFGGLAAIATATFKLAPLPTASATVVATFRDADATARAAGAISASQLDPAAFEVHSVAGRYVLLIQFASTQAAIDAQVRVILCKCRINFGRADCRRRIAHTVECALRSLFSGKAGDGYHPSDG